MNGDIIYRTGSERDKEQLKNLALIAFGQFRNVLTPENWAIMLGNLNNEENLRYLLERAQIFVCEHNGVFAGIAYLLPGGNPTNVFKAEWAYIRLLSVHPDYEGRGIGRKLTRMCINHARNTGEKVIALHTSEFQDAARHIYESEGFTILEELPQAYGKRYWLYTLNLT